MSVKYKDSEPDELVEQPKINDEKFHIYSVSWSSENQVSELASILEDTTAASVDRIFVHYVVDNIEPVGWKALWRPQNLDEICKHHDQNLLVDFLVYVEQVSLQVLEVIATINEVISTNENKNIGSYTELIGKQLSVPLIEIYPLAIQENENIDIETTAEVIEQIRFFFKHIWQPWDIFEEQCIYDVELLSKRRKIYEDIFNGILSPLISNEMNRVILEAESIAKKIRVIENESKIATEGELDQFDVAKFVSLNKRMDQCKEKYHTLLDPTLRELSFHQELIERKELLVTYFPEQSDSPRVLLCASSLSSIDDLVQGVSRLPEILVKLDEDISPSRVTTFPSLQMALDSARIGDVIALLPGTHSLCHIGAIAAGGAICGLGQGVEIEGSLSTGEVLVDLDVQDSQTFHLYSVVLRLLNNQTGLLVHRGRVSIAHCFVHGGSLGMSILGGSDVRVHQSSIDGCKVKSIECRGASKLSLDDVTVEKCPTAFSLSDETIEINLDPNLIISECDAGFVFTRNSRAEGNSDESPTLEGIRERILPKNYNIQYKKVDKEYSFEI